MCRHPRWIPRRRDPLVGGNPRRFEAPARWIHLPSSTSIVRPGAFYHPTCTDGRRRVLRPPVVLPETRRFIEQPETLARLRRTQAEYFDRLLAGDCHWRYALDRLRAGEAHRRAEHLRRQALESEGRFREVVEHATDGIVMTDEAGRIVFFNRAASEMFGYGRDEIAGRPATTLLTMPCRDRWAEAVRRRLADEDDESSRGVWELEGLRRDGSTFAMECGVSVCRVEARAVFMATRRRQSTLAAASRRAAMRPRRGTSVRSASSTSRACSATCTRCTPVAGAAAAGRPA